MGQDVLLRFQSFSYQRNEEMLEIAVGLADEKLFFIVKLLGTVTVYQGHEQNRDLPLKNNYFTPNSTSAWSSSEFWPQFLYLGYQNSVPHPLVKPSEIYPWQAL